MGDSWKYILEKFKIVPPDQQTILNFIIIFVVFILFVSAIEAILYFRRKKKKKAKEWRNYYKFGESFDLSDMEMEVLSELVKKFIPNTPADIFDSVLTFDNKTEKFLNQFKSWDADIDKDDAEVVLGELRNKCFRGKYIDYDDIKSTKEIPPGEQLRLTIKDNLGKHYFNGIIEESLKEYFSLKLDGKISLEFVFDPKETYEGYYWRKGDAGYRFPVRLITQMDTYSLKIKHTEDILRKQRRYFFRVHTRITGRFYRLADDEEKQYKIDKVFIKGDAPGNFLGTVVSLSGGGISFFTENSLLIAGKILWIELLPGPGEKFSDIIGRIVRVKNMERKFKVFVEFIHVSETNRDAIIKFIASCQRENSD